MAWQRHRLDTDHHEDETLSDEDVAAELSALLRSRPPTTSGGDDQRRRWRNQAGTAADARVAAIVQANRRIQRRSATHCLGSSDLVPLVP